MAAHQGTYLVRLCGKNSKTTEHIIEDHRPESAVLVRGIIIVCGDRRSAIYNPQTDELVHFDQFTPIHSLDRVENKIIFIHTFSLYVKTVE